MTSAIQNAVAVAVGATGFFFMREYFKGGVCSSQARMEGKTVLITGCNTGIGKETVMDLSQRGARVIMACRNLELANEAAAEVKKKTKGDIVVYKLDLANLSSVRECAKEINVKEEKIDVLINNAGVMMCPYSKTEDGFEMQIGTNHLGHFLFTNLLLDKLMDSAPSRVVTVSSRAHERGKMDLEDLHAENKKYNRMEAYEQSKLANIHFTRELSKRLKGTGVTTYALHPGVVRTELGRHIEQIIGPLKYLFIPLLFPFTKSPKEGAQTSIYCAVEESIASESGNYYSDCAIKTPQPQALDDKVAEKLWEVSSKSVDL